MATADMSPRASLKALALINGLMGFPALFLEKYRATKMTSDGMAVRFNFNILKFSCFSSYEMITISNGLYFLWTSALIISRKES